NQMLLHDINTLLNLQGVIINKMPEIVDNTRLFPVEPLDYTQHCPCCHSELNQALITFEN
ncbi:MAG: hypothetical protein ACRDBM_00615, partial [Sporomusa sp.]